MHKILAIVLLLAVAQANAGTDTMALSQQQKDQLDTLRVGASVIVGGFPDGFGGTAALRFERIDVYASGARVIAVGADGEHELARSQRVELIGADAAGDVRASLAFDPGFANVSGVGSGPSGAFVVTATTDARGVTIHAMPSTQALPRGVVPEIIAGDDALPSGVAAPDPLTRMLAGAAPATAPRGATIAIDTDNELMSRRFANNTTNATNWIADLIGAMNVMYQRDLNVVLQQGTTYLRTAPDPYTANDTPADQADLSEFGTYWEGHYGNVPRSFAALLSGKSSSGNSASGIAWVNAYCRTQSNGGSYSVTQVFTNAQIGVGYSALIVGHELGHNFGAYHTHCTNASTGGAPTGTNTIDKCFNTEPGCYTGATSCPTSGPGAPAGTVMSYCNVRQCGPGGQNVLQFHPTQISVLSALIAQNTPSCLAASSDVIFRNGFD
ncbi:MAG: M12 family metallo-peptidase [Lysobacterales bacterium]